MELSVNLKKLLLDRAETNDNTSFYVDIEPNSLEDKELFNWLEKVRKIYTVELKANIGGLLGIFPIGREKQRYTFQFDNIENKTHFKKFKVQKGY